MSKVLGLMSVVLVLAAGCKKEPEPAVEPAKPSRRGVASVEERMADKEYVKQLDGQRDQQKKLVKLMAEATNDADRAAVGAALEKNRQESMRLIRERMLKK